MNQITVPTKFHIWIDGTLKESGDWKVILKKDVFEMNDLDDVLVSKAGRKFATFLKTDFGMAVFLKFPKKRYCTEHLGGVTNLFLCFMRTIDLQNS